MNKNSTNIDNLFEKARNMEPVMDDSEVRELINSMPVVPANKSIFNYGVNKMTIISSISAIVVSGLILFNVLDSDVEKTDIFNNSQPVNSNNAHIEEHAQLPGNKEKDINKTYVNPNDVALNNVNIDDDVELPKSDNKISGINTITLPYDDLDLYNINFNQETNDFEINSSKVRLIISPDMKTQLYVNEDYEDADNKIAPKLITSANGNVKIALLTNNNSYGNVEWSADDQNRVLYTERIDEFPNMDLSALFAMLPPENLNPTTIDSLISLLGDSDNFGKFKIDKDKLSVHMNNFMNMSNLDLSEIENLEFEINFDNFDSNDKNIIFFQNDSILMNSKQIKIDLNNLDSLINNKIQQKIIIKRQNIDGNIDTSNSSELDFNLRLHNRKMNIMMHDNPTDLPLSMPFTKHSHLENRIKMIKEMTVNKLIPVRFETPGSGADVIFWFEPNNELLEIVPDKVKSRIEAEIAAINSGVEICKAAPETGSETIMDVWRSCSGAVENMMVYPNPTNGPVSVNFNLKDDRKVKLSIHDLTGKLLLTLAPETMIPKGEYRENFNLSKLTPGMYLLVAQTHYGEQTLQRIIIE